MRVFLGSDHAGVELRHLLAKGLSAQSHEVVVVGPADASISCDYPEVALEVCQSLLAFGPEARGILVCGSGQGMAMTANRLRGIRAAVVSDEYSAKMARMHNDANVLCLGQRVIGPGLASELVAVFLETPFAAGRHLTRLQKMDQVGLVGPVGRLGE